MVVSHLYSKLGEGLLKEKFVVMSRQGYVLPDGFVPNDNVIFLDVEDLGISSTQIREMVNQGDLEYKKLVPEQIGMYIGNYKL